MDGYGQYNGHFQRNWTESRANDNSNYENNPGFIPNSSSASVGNPDKMAYKPYSEIPEVEVASLAQYYSAMYRPRTGDVQTSSRTDIAQSITMCNVVEDRSKTIGISEEVNFEKGEKFHISNKTNFVASRNHVAESDSNNAELEWIGADKPENGIRNLIGKLSDAENNTNSGALDLKMGKMYEANCGKCNEFINDHNNTECPKPTVSIEGSCVENPEVSIDKFYTCGGCLSDFDTICKLHFHLEDHGSGGSYHYDHHTRRAFPKYDSVCNSTQTENSLDLNQKHTMKRKKSKSSTRIKRKMEKEQENERKVHTEIKAEIEDEILDIKFHEATLTELSANIDLNEGDNTVKVEPKQRGVELDGDENVLTEGHENKSIINSNALESNNDDTDEYSPEEILTKKKKKVHVKISKTKKDIKRGKTQLIKVKRKQQHLKSIACKVCNKKFTRQLHLRRHVRSEHKKDAFVCGICSSQFESDQELCSHRKDEHSSTVHQCELCSKILSTKGMLEGHYLVHKGIKPFACDVCIPKREFTRKSQLMAHMQTHSKVNHLQCEFCGKPFNARYLMINHVKHCAGIKPHKCDFCDMSFVSNHCLQRHRRTHTGEKPFVCEVCAFASSNASCLARHMRTHTGEKPFICKYCQQAFAAPGALKKHVRIHTQEKPYSCSYCSKAFTQKWNLKTHERQHTGETPYKCSVCGVGYKQNVLLKTHMKMHYDSMFNFNPAIPLSQQQQPPHQQHQQHSQQQLQHQQQSIGTNDIIHRAFTEM